MNASPLTVRPFERPDVSDVLGLMRGLAIFEGYIDKFFVTEADLIEHGLGDNPRFGVLVADLGGRAVGIAVHYVIPWTYDLKPALVLKELFVDETARSSGAGAALIAALKPRRQDRRAAHQLDRAGDQRRRQAFLPTRRRQPRCDLGTLDDAGGDHRGWRRKLAISLAMGRKNGV